MRRTLYTITLLLLLGIYSLVIITGCGTKEKELADITRPAITPTSIKAHATIHTESSRIKGRAVIIASKPDLVRVEIYGPMKRIVSIITGDTDNCYFYSEGSVAKCDWEDPDFLSPMPPAELVSLLLGTGAEAFKRKKDWEVSLDEEGRVKSLVKLKEGVEILRVSMQDYKNVTGALIPFTIGIEDDKHRISIKYKSVKINPRVKESIFNLKLINPAF